MSSSHQDRLSVAVSASAAAAPASILPAHAHEPLIFDAPPSAAGPGFIIPSPSPASSLATPPAPTSSESSSSAPETPSFPRSSPLYPLFLLWQSAARVLIPDSLAVDSARARALSPSQGARLAPRVAQLRPLDLVLVRTPGAVYRAARAAAGQPYDHMGIILSDPTTFLHVGPPSARVLPSQLLVDPARAPLVLRPRLSAQEAAEVLASLKELVGAPYHVAKVYSFIAKVAAEKALGVAPTPAPALDSAEGTESGDASSPAPAVICTDAIMLRLLRASAPLRALCDRHAQALHATRFGVWSLEDVVVLHAAAVAEARASRAAIASGTDSSPVMECLLSEVPLPPAPPLGVVSPLGPPLPPAQAAVPAPALATHSTDEGGSAQSDAAVSSSSAGGNGSFGRARGVGRGRAGPAEAVELLHGVLSSVAADLSARGLSASALVARGGATGAAIAAAGTAAGAAVQAARAVRERTAGAAAAVAKAVMAASGRVSPDSTSSGVTAGGAAAAAGGAAAAAGSFALRAASAGVSRARALSALADDAIDALFDRAEAATLEWMLSKGFWDDVADSKAAATAAAGVKDAANKTDPSSVAVAAASAAAAAAASAFVGPKKKSSGVGNAATAAAAAAGGVLQGSWASARQDIVTAAQRAGVRALYTLLRRVWAVAKPAARLYLLLYVLSWKLPWLLLLRGRLTKALVYFNVLAAVLKPMDPSSATAERRRRRKNEEQQKRQRTAAGEEEDTLVAKL